MNGERKVSIYHSLTKNMLVMDGEREPVLCLLFTCAIIVISGMAWLTTIIGLSMWLVGLYVLQAMAKNDPMMFRVFLRYLFRYRQRVYPASSLPLENNNYVEFSEK